MVDVPIESVLDTMNVVRQTMLDLSQVFASLLYLKQCSLLSVEST